MSRFDPELADTRFGCGLSPRIAPPVSAEAMLTGLTAPDQMASAFPIETFPQFRERLQASKKLWKIRKKTRGTDRGEEVRKEINLLKKAARQDMYRWFGQSMLRQVNTSMGFRERLSAFWADHFTAQGKAGVLKRGATPYVESAIRPHIAGRFSDLLQAAITHPLMLHYLDQSGSIGPNSPKAARRGPKAGMNENLAREVLELHTLGVDGPYTQTDVRQLAELLTGLTWQAEVGFKYRKDFAEPGSETVLGVEYPDSASMKPVRAVLDDLATHPATARHIAHKLAVHFVSDTPDASLLSALEHQFLKTGGELLPLYETLLTHPAAWSETGRNIKTPLGFVGSALRALDPPAMRIQSMTEKQTRGLFVEPMMLMGQLWQQPAGPDGWPEDDAHWVTPQGLSARIRWAMSAPSDLLTDLPDPREFAKTAVGSRLSPKLRFAATEAESRREAIGLILCSPEFQRR